MAEAVIVAGARTPIGKLSGALAGFSAMELGGFAIAEALKRAGLSGDQVDYVLMGQVILAGQNDLAHEDVVALVTAEPGPLERLGDGEATELHGAEARQCA